MMAIARKDFIKARLSVINLGQLLYKLNLFGLSTSIYSAQSFAMTYLLIRERKDI